MRLAIYTVAAVLSGCGSSTTVASATHCMTPAEATTQAVDGDEVRICGYGNLALLSTLLLCDPPSCDCNDTSGLLHLNETPERTSEHVEVIGLLCGGNECTVGCSPFNPLAAPAFEIVGKATVSYEITLQDIDLQRSYQLTGAGNLDEMERSPLELGDVSCSCAGAPQGYCSAHDPSLSCAATP